MSRLVVDVLQGNAATGNKITVPSGHTLIASGHVLQVQQYTLRNYTVSTSSSEAKFMETSIVTKAANSRVLVKVMLPHGSYNQDVDLGAAVGYATAISALPTGYNSLHGTYTRQSVTNLGSFWAQDTSEPGGGTWSGGYFVVPRYYEILHAPGYAAGTTIYYSVWVTSGDGTGVWGKPYSSGAADSGQDCSITLVEVAQ